MSFLPNRGRRFSLCSLALRLALLPALLPCLPAHADSGGNGPIITNAQLSASSIPATGGSLNLSATITDTAIDPHTGNPAVLAGIYVTVTAANGLPFLNTLLPVNPASSDYTDTLSLAANTSLETHFTVTLTAVDTAGNSAMTTVGAYTQLSSDNAAALFQN